MLESHLCPFETAEAPCGLNKAKVQNPIQGHPKIPLYSLAFTFSVLTNCPDLLTVYIFFNANRLLSFPIGFLIEAFGQEEDFTQPQSGRKSRDLVRLHGKNRSWG